jgi:hypothetical protein
LAAVRAAAQIVVGHHQQLAATFKMVKIYKDDSGWREARDAASPSLRTDLKIFCSGLAAETLFTALPPLEYRAHDYWHIKNCASCVKGFHPKMTLTEIIERALPNVFEILVREHLSVARIASELLKHERLNGGEILKLVRSDDDVG